MPDPKEDWVRTEVVEKAIIYTMYLFAKLAYTLYSRNAGTNCRMSQRLLCVYSISHHIA